MRGVGRLSGAASVLHRVPWAGPKTTNNPAESDLYRLVLKDSGYVLDGEVKPFEDAHRNHQGTGNRTDRFVMCCWKLRRRPAWTGRGRSRRFRPIAMRVAAIDRPRLFEQFWRMGLAKNLDEWQDAMRMQQLPLFNTVNADRDGHIAYVYNATLWAHKDRRLSVLARRRARRQVRAHRHLRSSPYDAHPQGDRSAHGLGAELQRHAVDVGVSDDARLLRSSPPASPRLQGITQRAQRGIRILSYRTAQDDVRGHQEVESCPRVSRPPISSWTRLSSNGQRRWGPTARSGRRTCSPSGIIGEAEVGKRWHAGLLQVHEPLPARASASIGGFKIPTDDWLSARGHRAGFNDPAKATATLDTVAGEVEKEYGSLERQVGRCHAVPPRQRSTFPATARRRSWARFSRSLCSSFVERQDPRGVFGDTFYAVIESRHPLAR